MASAHLRSFPATLLLALLFLFDNGLCFNPKLFHAMDAAGTNNRSFIASTTTSTGSFAKAVATWYGDKNGAGSPDGACGYTDTVSRPPINSMVAAGSSALFEGGKGCGACYLVKCTPDTNKACSGTPVKVMIMDQAPELEGLPHFDFGGIAMGAMATSSNGEALRNAGQFHIQYQRTDCKFGRSLTFKVDSSSNNFSMSLLVEYVNGVDDITAVELQETGSATWQAMKPSWGALYKLDAGHQLSFPLSVRVTTGAGSPVVATNVIPKGWTAGASYNATSNVNE